MRTVAKILSLTESLCCSCLPSQGFPAREGLFIHKINLLHTEAAGRVVDSLLLEFLKQTKGGSETALVGSAGGAADGAEPRQRVAATRRRHFLASLSEGGMELWLSRHPCAFLTLQTNAAVSVSLCNRGLSCGTSEVLGGRCQQSSAVHTGNNNQ